MTAVARKSVRPLTPAEARADALLAQIADDELDALAITLARLLLSAARNRGKPQRAAPKPPTRLRAARPKPAQKSAARG